MSVSHHPEEALLLDFAAGRLEPAMTLVIGVHLHFCAACRDVVALGEAIGGVLLADAVPAPLAPGSLARVLARLDDHNPSVAMNASNDDTPPTLKAFMGRDLSAVRWRAMGPRLGYATLYRRRGQTLRLLRGSPGSDVGAHTHHGQEYTLVLRGGFSDETGSYGPGDFQVATSAMKHNPVADPGEDCINLALTTAGLRFDSPFQTVVAKFFGF